MTKVHELVDAFTGTTLDSQWEPYQVTMTGTAARLNADATAAALVGWDRDLDTYALYDLTDSSLAVNWQYVDTNGIDTRFSIYLSGTSGYYSWTQVWMEVTGHAYVPGSGILPGAVRMKALSHFYGAAPDIGDETSIAYDPDAHAWMRIRQDNAGTVSFDTAPRWGAWTEQFGVAGLEPLTATLVQLAVDGTLAGTSTTVEVNAVNIGDASTLRVRANEGMLLVGTGTQPLYIRTNDGWRVYPDDGMPLYQRYPDGTWQPVT